MTKPIVLLSFVVLLILSFFYVDKPIAYDLRNLNLKHMGPLLNRITHIGMGGVYLVPLFLLALFFRVIYHNKTYEIRSWFLWGSVLIPSLMCLGLKMLLGRARPDLLFDQHLYGFYGFKTQAIYWSFPSGHATTVMGFVFGMWALFPRFWYAFLVPGLIVVSSRVLLTQHYLSDVLAASYLSLLGVGLVLWCFRRNHLLLKRAF
ncbi:MAG: phosphatase PAP2 family protein [Legionellales bacterium]|nr:phosphatase PAP2 family protein [Legionellales bacterium]